MDVKKQEENCKNLNEEKMELLKDKNLLRCPTCNRTVLKLMLVNGKKICRDCKRKQIIK